MVENNKLYKDSSYQPIIDPELKKIIKAERKNLRLSILNERNALSLEQVNILSNQTIQKVLAHNAIKGKKNLTIASYVSAGRELDTLLLNQQIINLGHTLALPVINFNCKGMMEFHTCRDLNLLVSNRFNIFEPVPQEDTKVAPDEIDVIFVPLVGFNHKGERLGMGGGYYDRILKQINQDCLTIGLAYDFQYNENISSQEWDVAIKEVITPHKHYKFSI